MKKIILTLCVIMLFTDQVSAQNTASFYDVVYDKFGTHVMNDFTGQTVLSDSAELNIRAMEYDATASTLYGLNFANDSLVILNQANGSVETLVGYLTNIPNKNVVSGLAITPNGDCFVSTFGPEDSALFSCDLQTAELTLIGQQENAPQISSLAADCNGTLYAHDNSTDGFYTLDPSNGSVNLIGLHGLNTSSTQGLTFDRQEGNLYAYMSTGLNGAGSNSYARVNINDGSVDVLATDNPLGRFVGASRTVCSRAEPQTVDATSDFTLLLFMALLMTVAWRQFK